MTGPAASRSDWPEAVRAAVAAGADWLQVRDRDLPAGALLAFGRALAQAAREGARARGGSARILLNRRADVALAAGVDGLHLGFDALPLAAARRVLGELGRGGFVGVSTHSVGEVTTAARDGADYAHLAPIFDPISKERERPALGPDGLADAAAARGSAGAGLRLIAQGGITAERVGEALRAGADGVAVTGAVFSATHPGDAAARLRATLDRAGR